MELTYTCTSIAPLFSISNLRIGIDFNIIQKNGNKYEKIVLEIKSKLDQASREEQLSLILHLILIPCILGAGIESIMIIQSGRLVVSESPSYVIDNVNHHVRGAATVKREDIDASYKMSEVGFSGEAKHGLRNNHGEYSEPIEIQERSFRHLGGEVDEYGYSNYVAIVEDGSIYTGEVDRYSNQKFGGLTTLFETLAALTLGVFCLSMLRSNLDSGGDYVASILYVILYVLMFN